MGDVMTIEMVKTFAITFIVVQFVLTYALHRYTQTRVARMVRAIHERMMRDRRVLRATMTRDERDAFDEWNGMR